jgi:hypothetical protein
VTEIRALRRLRTAFHGLAPRANSLTAAEWTMISGHVCEAADVMQCAGLLTDRVVNSLRDMALSAGMQWVDNPQLDELIVRCVDQLHAISSPPRQPHCQ